MSDENTYQARCHCGALRYSFRCEPITAGRRCNCSICSRKGIVMSAIYLSPTSIVQVEGMERLSLYQFGDHDVNHYFCRTCGICPFVTVASVPPDYVGPVHPGDFRINLGCVEGLDVYALAIEIIDGRAL